MASSSAAWPSALAIRCTRASPTTRAVSSCPRPSWTTPCRSPPTFHRSTASTRRSGRLPIRWACVVSASAATPASAAPSRTRCATLSGAPTCRSRHSRSRRRESSPLPARLTHARAHRPMTLLTPWLGRLVLIALALFPAAASAFAADEQLAGDEQAAWAALAGGGHIALIRHGNAPPGFGGDPPGFRIDDCKTQRNLDDKGRAQGKALGDAFRSHGVSVDRILSSLVCRCMDTASLMAVGNVESSWALVPDRDPSRPRFRELKEIVSNWRGPGTLVLVSHGFTIEPLTGIMPDQAEVLVLRPTPGIGNGASVVGRIPAPR